MCRIHHEEFIKIAREPETKDFAEIQRVKVDWKLIELADNSAGIVVFS